MNIKDYKETRDEDMHSYQKVICTTPTPPTPNPQLPSTSSSSIARNVEISL